MEYFKLSLGTSNTFYCKNFEKNIITAIKLISKDRVVLQTSRLYARTTKTYSTINVHHLAEKCTKEDFENAYNLFKTFINSNL